MTRTLQLGRPGLLDRVGWLLVLFTLATALLPVPAAKATDTICVALVVDFSPLGGGVDSGCTRVPSGATGYDVLHAGGHTFEICSNGVLGTIDGKPAHGCQIKDNNHFWGYWHRKPGSRTWTFSNYGAGFYHPVEGSTEGWVWEDGTTNPPADVPYPADCHSPPRSASPTPAATHHSSPAATHSAAPVATQAGGSTAGGLNPTAGTTPPPSGRPRAHATSPAATTATASTSPTQLDAGADATTPTKTADRATTDAGAGHVMPVLIGVCVAALLGVGAWWRAHGQGRS